MPDFNFYSGEKTNEAVDTALKYVAPINVAENGPDSVLPVLKVAKKALACIYHPDKAIDLAEADIQTGQDALVEIDGVIRQIENESQEYMPIDLADSISADSLRLVGGKVRKLVQNTRELEHLNKFLQYFQHNTGAGGASRMDLEKANDAEVRYKNLTLGLIFGDTVLRLIAAEGVPQDHRDKALKIIRAKLEQLWTSGTLGISSSEFGTTIDNALGAVGTNEETIVFSNDEEETIRELTDESEQKASEAASKIVEYMRPNSSRRTPENWWRNFSGDLVVPVNLELWDDYEEVLGQGMQPELSDVAVLSIDAGVVSDLVILNPEERFKQGTALLSRLPQLQRIWCEELIDHVAMQMAVLEDYYLGNSYSHGRKASFVDENGQALDFMFKVEKDGTAETLYYRLNYKKQLVVPKIKLEVGKAPKPGYYMLKAGKVGGEYPVPNTPIGLVHLNPIDDDSLVRTIRGAAFAGIATQDGSMLKVSSALLSDKEIGQMGRFIPATAGKALSVRDDHLAEVVRGSINQIGIDYYKSTGGERKARNLAFFIGKKGGAVLSTFGDEAIHAIPR